MKRILSSFKNGLAKKQKIKFYVDALTTALKDWDDEDKIPDNIIKCVEEYIIKESANINNRDNFYTALSQKLQSLLIESNVKNIDRLIQIFTQAQNTEINNKVIAILTDIVQKNLDSENSKLKNNKKLIEKLSEIIKDTFNQDNNDEEQTESKEDKSNAKTERVENGKNTFSKIAYENLLKLLNSKSETSIDSSEEKITESDNVIQNSIVISPGQENSSTEITIAGDNLSTNKDITVENPDC